jgi:hypothetical protein
MLFIQSYKVPANQGTALKMALKALHYFLLYWHYCFYAASNMERLKVVCYSAAFSNYVCMTIEHNNLIKFNLFVETIQFTLCMALV